MLALTATQLLATGAAAPPPPAVVEMVEEWRAEQKAPGVSVAAASREGVLWAAGYGLADLETERAATPETRYQFASVTKPFTGLLTAMLVEDGTVRLEQPLSALVPGIAVASPPPGSRPITLGDIATHTAGLTRDMTGPKASGKSHAYTLAELTAWLASEGFAVQPGIQHKYSNFGFALLGQALARAAGQDYRDLLRDRVLGPLGLKDTGLHELRTHPLLASSYTEREGELSRVADPVWDFGAQAPASEIISTVVDVARFATAHLGGPGEGKLPDRVTARLFTPLFPIGDSSMMGLSWHYFWSDGLPRWEHGGAVNGYRSLVAVRADVGLAVVLAANAPVSWDGLNIRLLRALSEHADVSGIERSVGDYETPDGTLAMVRLRPDAVLTLEVKGAVRLLPIGPATFRVIEGTNKGEWVRFVVEDGREVMLWEHRRLTKRNPGA